MTKNVILSYSCYISYFTPNTEVTLCLVHIEIMISPYFWFF